MRSLRPGLNDFGLSMGGHTPAERAPSYVGARVEEMPLCFAVRQITDIGGKT